MNDITSIFDLFAIDYIPWKFLLVKLVTQVPTSNIFQWNQYQFTVIELHIFSVALKWYCLSCLFLNVRFAVHVMCTYVLYIKTIRVKHNPLFCESVLQIYYSLKNLGLAFGLNWSEIKDTTKSRIVAHECKKYILRFREKCMQNHLRLNCIHIKYLYQRDSGQWTMEVFE